MNNASLTDQVVDFVSARIRSGDYPIGSVLPAADSLAEAVGCSPETAKRALRRLAREGITRGVQRRGTIVARRPSLGVVGFLLSGDEHTNGLFQQPIYDALTAADFDVDVIAGGQDPVRTLDWCRRILSGSRTPTGIVAIGADYVTGSQATAAAELLAGFPRRVCFTLDGVAPVATGSWTWVTSDVRSQAKQVIRHLWDLGHRRISAFVEHVPTAAGGSVTSVAGRYCADLLEVAGGTFVPFYESEGVGPLLELIRRQEVTAFWGLNDSHAVCVLSHFYEAGLRVPDDVSLIGRNNTPWSEQAMPPLTSVSLNPGGVADAVVDALIASKPKDLYEVEPELVVRASTGPAPEA